MRRLVVALDAELAPDIPPHSGIADFHRLEGVDVDGLRGLTAAGLVRRDDRISRGSAAFARDRPAQ